MRPLQRRFAGYSARCTRLPLEYLLKDVGGDA